MMNRWSNGQAVTREIETVLCTWYNNCVPFALYDEDFRMICEDLKGIVDDAWFYDRAILPHEIEARYKRVREQHLAAPENRYYQKEYYIWDIIMTDLNFDVYEDDPEDIPM